MLNININIMKQFDMTRETLLKSIYSISESDVDIMPIGFNNTIKWHIGHILFAANRTFTITKLTSHLSSNYIEMFKPGTSPKDWTNDIPSLKALLEKLDQQKVLIREAFSGRITETLETPFKIDVYGGHEFLSIGEMLNFFIFHESMHIGYINALKRVISSNH